MKQRLDILLVDRELVESREKAHAIILAGEVLVNDTLVDKPATRVNDDSIIRLRQKPAYVSRGGLKLAHALDQFNVDVCSMVVLDIGASTGGFTDCLLQRGARTIYAVDVGYGQLDYRLRVDPRVVAMERVNARHPFNLPEQVDLITIDVSFISLEKVIPNITMMVKPGGILICLVKPQFEAGRGRVSKGGLVKDPRVHAQVLGRFIVWATEAGFKLGGLTASPISGATGNKEFLVLLRV
jgi:23S rRNA (cytidine1920-2'-O)/16S rRNA (cytidine1409-2'-O)-methyltransferase